ncbi:hypothetical protein HHK36_021627 [Tetracentron sinense]|uniref:Uncharacterized protein n=1 Tax=Tetracentron sinense TaxID=13715 RepID=A0A834YQ30_TETSI|nr:hypothetical protein HHK36_021627 [Tetracentron sinense]
MKFVISQTFENQRGPKNFCGLQRRLSSAEITSYHFFLGGSISLNSNEEVEMASATTILPPSLFVHGRKSLFRSLRKLPVSAVGERQRRVAVVVKATGESSESSSSLSIVKSVQSVWDKSEDRIAIAGLGFAAIVALWASTNLITVIATILS